MERILNQDERIRRAEEIYYRRQNLRERTQRATLNVSNEPRNFRLFKKIILQVVICTLIYFIFYLINTTNYSFSEEAISKTEEIISQDVDFIGIYNNIANWVGSYISSQKVNLQTENVIEETFVENEIENSVQKEAQEKTENIEQTQSENIAITENIDETTGQKEIKDINLSETDRIKQQYSFSIPVKGTISSEFGEREATSSIMSTYHKGIDIAANTGTSIIAATNGTVKISKYSSSYGNYILLENGEVKTVYAHCSELLVKERRYCNTGTRNC